LRFRRVEIGRDHVCHAATHAADAPRASVGRGRGCQESGWLVIATSRSLCIRLTCISNSRLAGTEQYHEHVRGLAFALGRVVNATCPLALHTVSMPVDAASMPSSSLFERPRRSASLCSAIARASCTTEAQRRCISTRLPLLVFFCTSQGGHAPAPPTGFPPQAQRPQLTPEVSGTLPLLSHYPQLTQDVLRPSPCCPITLHTFFSPSPSFLSVLIAPLAQGFLANC